MAETDVAPILTLIQDVKHISEESHRTLRGHNGTLGLVAKTAQLEARLVDLVENILPEMEERILQQLLQNTERTVTWPWLLQNFLVPVITAVLTSGVLWLVYRSSLP